MSNIFLFSKLSLNLAKEQIDSLNIVKEVLYELSDIGMFCMFCGIVGVIASEALKGNIEEQVEVKEKEVKCFKVNSCDKSNSWYKKLDEEYKSLGASAVGFVKLNEENELVGSFAKLLSDDEKTKLIVEKIFRRKGRTLCSAFFVYM